MSSRRKVFGDRLSRLARMLGDREEGESTEVPDSAVRPPGGRIGKYRILREVARGGMGIVYEAEDPELKRRVALKVLKDSDAPAGLVKRLHREAAIAAQLDHPNIVSVHEVSMVRDAAGAPLHFIAMAFVEGRTLHDLVREGGTDRPVLLSLLESTARALAYAHDRGIVHRDIKPANVMVDPSGRALLTDFGLARADLFDTALTRSKSLVGTPMYMAPEQVEGRTRDIGVRTDVYALGVVLYEILTGRPPFAASVPAELYRKILQEDPERPTLRDPGIPRDLEVICLKAMQKDPVRRYAGAAEFADDLARFLRGERVVARPTSLLYRVRKTLTRRRAAVATAAAAVLAVLALAVLLPLLLRESREKRDAERAVSLWSALSPVFTEAELLARSGEPDASRDRIEEGIAFCRRFLEEGEHALAHYFLGRLMRMKGDESSAERALDRALSLDPELHEARFERGQILVDRYGRLLEFHLQPLVLPTLDTGPWGSPAIGEAEEMHPELKELRERAASDLSAPVGGSRYVTSVEAIYGRGELARLRGEFDSAKEDFERVLTEDRLHVRALVSLANLHWARCEFEPAIALATRTIRSHGGLAAAYLVRSRSYDWLAGSRPYSEEAEEWRRRSLADADRAIELGARSADAYDHRGVIRANAEDYAGAREDFGRALEIEPRHSMARVHRAYAWINEEKFDAAIEECTSVLEQHRRHVAALLNRGTARGLKGDLAGAVDDFSRVIEMRPDDPAAYYNRGHMHLAAGNRDEAFADFTCCIERKPDHASALAERGGIRYRNGDFDAAIRDFSEAIKIHPRMSRAYLGRGLARGRKGEYAEAEADLTRSVELEESAFALAGRALAREQTGNPSGAVEDARRALELEGLTSDQRRQLKDLIRRLQGGR